MRTATPACCSTAWPRGCTDVQRLIVLGRRLPERCGAPPARRRPPADRGGPRPHRRRDARGSAGEGFGLDVDEDVALAIDGATGGWTAATVLAAARAKRTGESVLELAEQTRATRALGAVAAILDEAVVRARRQGPRRPRPARLGSRCSTPTSSTPRSARAFFDRALAAGVAALRDRRRVVGPRRARARLPRSPRAAPTPRRCAARRTATATLGRARPPRSTCSSRSATTTRRPRCSRAGDLAAVDAMDVREYRAAVDRLSDDAVGPARWCSCCSPVLRLRGDVRASATRRSRALDALCRARSATPRSSARIAAERATDLVRARAVRRGRGDGARGCSTRPPRDEVLTRGAAARRASGATLCWHYDDDGRRDAAALREADVGARRGRRALRAARHARRRRPGMAPYRAMWIQFARGDAARRAARLDEAIGADRRPPAALGVPALAARRGDARARPARRDVAHDRRDPPRRRAAGRRPARRLRALERDVGGAPTPVTPPRRSSTSASSRRTRATGGPRRARTSARRAAEDLARIGEIALADEHLAMAKAEPRRRRRAHRARPRASLLARHGDPEAAEAVLARCPGHGHRPARVLADRPAPRVRGAAPRATAPLARSPRAPSRRSPRLAPRAPAAHQGAPAHRGARRARRRDRPARGARAAGRRPARDRSSVLGRFELAAAAGRSSSPRRPAPSCSSSSR